MMQTVSLETEAAHPGALLAQHRLRHRIFVERLGWTLPTVRGLEYDQFDTPAATYLVWRSAEGEAHGVARLIPTDQPYMLDTLWPDLCGGHRPHRPDVWEGSRFGVDHAVPAGLRQAIAEELVIGCLEFGVARGISEYIVLMPTFFIRRQIGGAGCSYRMLGQTRKFGAVEMAVAAIEVSAETLVEARLRANRSEPVLQYANMEAAA